MQVSPRNMTSNQPAAPGSELCRDYIMHRENLVVIPAYSSTQQHETADFQLLWRQSKAPHSAALRLTVPVADFDLRLVERSDGPLSSRSTGSLRGEDNVQPVATAPRDRPAGLLRSEQMKYGMHLGRKNTSWKVRAFRVHGWHQTSCWQIAVTGSCYRSMKHDALSASWGRSRTCSNSASEFMRVQPSKKGFFSQSALRFCTEQHKFTPEQEAAQA